MYHLLPYKYLVCTILSIGMANTVVEFSPLGLLHFEPVLNTTCVVYMALYIEKFGGYLKDLSAVIECEFCIIADTNTLLTSVNVDYGERWKNFGILWIFIGFNALMAVFWHWLVRIPK